MEQNPPTQSVNFRAHVAKVARNDFYRYLKVSKSKKRSAKVIIALDEFTSILPNEKYASDRNDEEIRKLVSLFRKQKVSQRIFVLKYFYFESNRDIAEKYGYTEREAKI